MKAPFSINKQSALRLVDKNGQVVTFRPGDEEAVYDLLKSSPYRLQKVLRSGSTVCLDPDAMVGEDEFKQLEAEHNKPAKKKATPKKKPPTDIREDEEG